MESWDAVTASTVPLVDTLSVYVVDADLDRYRCLLSDRPDGPLGPLSGMPVYIENFGALSPDVWCLISFSDVFVVTPPVIRRLEPFLSMAGDLVPLKNATREAWEFRALQITSALKLEEFVDVTYGHEERLRLLRLSLDRVGSEDAEILLANAAAGDIFPYLAPAFRAEPFADVPSTFFRLDRFPATVFLLDRDDDDDTLLRRLERYNMSGLSLNQVWSSDAGPRDINLFGSD